MFEWMIPLLNADGEIGASSGVESVPAAEEQATPQVESGSQTGVDTQAVAEPEKQNNYEKAFAKRLAEAEKKWQADTAEKYKDYEDVKSVAEYFREVNQVPDVMSLKEQIEMTRLQERAEMNEISPEMQRRLESLEAKAAKADELEQGQQEDHRVQAYHAGLSDFVKDKGVTSEELNQFMIDNNLVYNPDDMNKSFNVALRAMKAEDFEKLASAKEEEVINKYLASKQAPKVEGSTGAAGTQSVDTSKMSWKDLNKHAAARLDASKTAQ